MLLPQIYFGGQNSSLRVAIGEVKRVFRVVGQLGA
jgi:hypothetical protein